MIWHEHKYHEYRIGMLNIYKPYKLFLKIMSNCINNYKITAELYDILGAENLKIKFKTTLNHLAFTYFLTPRHYRIYCRKRKT